MRINALISKFYMISTNVMQIFCVYLLIRINRWGPIFIKSDKHKNFTKYDSEMLDGHLIHPFHTPVPNHFIKIVTLQMSKGWNECPNIRTKYGHMIFLKYKRI